MPGLPTTHIVRPGDYLSKIAKQYRFTKWETIYYHPENADFRRKRPNPNVIYPGDRIHIPDVDRKIEPGATEQVHRFRLEGDRLRLRIVIRDHEGRALANEPYLISLDREEIRGSTDAEGLLDEEIPIGVTSGRLRIERLDLDVPLRIGMLDPTDDGDAGSPIVTGAQGRLNNLGFFCGQVDGDEGPKTTAAVRSFQESVLGRREPTGELDKETRDALVREHGC